MTQPTVTLPREVVKYLTMYFEVNGESTDERNAAGALRAALDAPQAAPDMVEENDKAVGKKWREDSRLEEWFPITAEKLAALEVEVHKLRMRHPFGEAVAWRRWNNKWHEYEYAGNPQVDVGPLVDWEPLAAVPRTALDAPAKVNCGGCIHHYAVRVLQRFDLRTDKVDTHYCDLRNCINYDKFQALPPISLTKVTK